MNWLRNKLGITQLLQTCSRLEGQIASLKTAIQRRDDAIQMMIRTNGILIAKLDPNRGIPEDNPIRRAESDRLGAEAIRRLHGEIKEQNRYE